MDSIDVGRAIKTPFNDKQWVSKTLLGFLWLLLGVTAPAVFGAQIEYVKSVSEGREDLPTWDDFGGKWVKGFLIMVAYFIYLLPIWVLGFILVVPGIIAAATSNGEAGAGLLSGGVCLFSVIAIVYGLGIAVLMYGATVNYAIRGGFGSLFAVSEILEHVRDGSGYFAAWLWAIVIGFAASAITSVLSATGIGGILAPAVLYLEFMMIAHVFGQWAAKSYGGAVAAAPAAPAGYMPPPAYAPPTPPPPPAPAPYEPAAPQVEQAPPPEPPAPPVAAPPEPPAPPVAAPPAPPAPPAEIPPAAPAPPAVPPEESPTPPPAAPDTAEPVE